MTELKLGNDTNSQSFRVKNVSFFGLFTCLATFVLAFMFKDYLINLLNYLEVKSNTNIFEFHLILLFLFICVSLPILWGYLICVLICAFVYSFVIGFLLVVAYSAFGMAASFYICRYTFYDCAHQRVNSVPYLKAIITVIESNEKGFKVIFLSRLMPIPFGLANTVFSVTDVSIHKYLLASIIGLMPSQLILCYMGSMLKTMSDVLSDESTAKTATLVFVAQLFIAVGVMYYILNAAKSELDKHIIKANKLNEDLSENAVLVPDGRECKGTDECQCEHCQLVNVVVK